MATTLTPTSQCRAKDPSKCPYHGAYSRMNNAASQAHAAYTKGDTEGYSTAINAYETARKQIIAMEATKVDPDDTDALIAALQGKQLQAKPAKEEAPVISPFEQFKSEHGAYQAATKAVRATGVKVAQNLHSYGGLNGVKTPASWGDPDTATNYAFTDDGATIYWKQDTWTHEKILDTSTYPGSRGNYGSTVAKWHHYGVDDNDTTVGAKVAKAFKDAGFNVSWDGTTKDFVRVDVASWQDNKQAWQHEKYLAERRAHAIQRHPELKGLDNQYIDEFVDGEEAKLAKGDDYDAWLRVHLS